MTPQHAVDTFTKTRMDVLVLGNHVVRRNGGAQRVETEATASA
jgi:hypothetical protein